MARTKQVPLPNVEKKKLKEFFVEAIKSTPKTPSETCARSSKSSKKSCTTGSSRRSSSQRSSSQRSSSQRSSSQSTSLQKSSSRRSKSQGSDVKKRRAPGVAALQEIRKLQKSTHLLIPRAAFIRVVRNVLAAEENRRRKEDSCLKDGFLLQDMRFTGEALQCLQEAAEVQLTNFFTMSYFCTWHARRKTLMVRDCQLARLLLGRNHPLNP